MNSEWNENASRTRGCSKWRATKRCSGTIAPSRSIAGISAANAAGEPKARRPAARMPSW